MLMICFPQKATICRVVPIHPRVGNGKPAALFFSRLDQAPWTRFLSEMLLQLDAPRQQPGKRVCSIGRMSQASHPSRFSVALPPLSVLPSCPAGDAAPLLSLSPRLLLPSLLADSWFGGHTVDQLIEDLQNHSAVIKGWCN